MSRLVAFVALPVVAAGLLMALRLLGLDDSYAGTLLAFGVLSLLATLLIVFVRRRPARVAAPRPAAPPSADSPPPGPPAAEAAAPAVAAAPTPPASPAPPPSAPPAGELGPPLGAPRGYMGEANGAAPAHDYMRKRLTEPREPADTPQRAPVPPAPTPRQRAPAEAAASPQRREPAESFASRVPVERERPAPAAGEFIPFETPVAASARTQEPAPAAPAMAAAGRAGAGNPSLPSFAGAPSPAVGAWTPAPPVVTEPGAGALRTRAVTPSVNLGRASRALQRRLPSALAYYRREGVSTAVWAGVATSVLVTAFAWRARRNGRSSA